MHRKDFAITLGILTIICLVATAFIYSCISFSNFRQNKSLLESLRRIPRGRKSDVYQEFLTGDALPSILQASNSIEDKVISENFTLNTTEINDFKDNVLSILNENVKNSKKYNGAQSQEPEGTLYRNMVLNNTVNTTLILKNLTNAEP